MFEKPMTDWSTPKYPKTADSRIHARYSRAVINVTGAITLPIRVRTAPALRSGVSSSGHLSFVNRRRAYFARVGS